MLKYLNIKNFALIENSDINFSSGLNIITGETGSGKSIIIQALSILLGGRASVEHIRTGMDEAVLNATIEITGKTELLEYLNKIGITVEDDDLIIRRILTQAGKSRSFINGTQVTSREMSVISSNLFDFHGQHDGISLLKKSTHLRYLDDFLNLGNSLNELKVIYNELKKTEESLKFLNDNEKDKENRIELLKHEISEIEKSEIKDNEDEELKSDIKIYENLEKIISSLEEAHALFIGESGVNSKLKKIKNLLLSISESDSSFNNYANDVSDIFYKLEDISYDLSSMKDKYDYTPGMVDRIIERSEIIEKLKRKYGGSISEIRKYLEKAKEELGLIEFSEEEKNRLTNLLEELKQKYLDKAIEISEKRKQGSNLLDDKVKKELILLAMENVEFKINIETSPAKPGEEAIIYQESPVKYSKDGIDNVEFLISPNKGEPLKSLIKIASGGELSRIVLSLKTVLVENDFINTMIFDEIDAGIGGKVGLSVGKSLKKLSNNKQIICITHLPQIASVGDKNFLIKKEVSGDRTVSTIDELDKKAKVKEIARMLSGNITEVSITHANELINSMN